MVRLNLEDFSKLFVCLDVIFLTFSCERARQELQKNVKFFRNFSNFHENVVVFDSFFGKTFLYSELLQSHDIHKILHEIPHRIVYDRS